MLLTLAVSPAFADSGPYVSFPCQDGWMACLQGGFRIEPGTSDDADGRPQPADQRLGWFDLEATANFSPFVELSDYEQPPAVAAPAPPPPRPAVVQPAMSPPPDAPVNATPTPTPTPTPSVVSVPEPVTPEPVAPEPVAPEPVSPEPVTPEPVAPDPVAPEPAPDDDAVAMVEQPEPLPPVVDDGCENLEGIEVDALVGRVSEGTRGCLEQAFGAAGRMSRKDKISRLLMVDAFARNDTARWAQLVERHLEDVDQSDPDLAYRYSRHQASNGSHYAAIRWADVALENRSVWTGRTYVDRVSRLYKIRAASAQSLWKEAEQAHASAPSEDTNAKVKKARDLTKEFAREWYEYTKVAGLDTSVSFSVCVSAAGTQSYCEAR